MIGLMDRHPEFRFNQSTAQLYAFLEEDDPALFARIKEKADGGQWEPIGAMWVEPDTNMPTGESFVRQLLYGQRYFERTFGRATTSAGCPTASASRPALPQLLHQAGVDELLHHQGELVRDQHDALRPLLVGGHRRQPGARPHLRQPGRRLQRRDRRRAPSSRPGRTTAASTATPRACSPSATATAAAARPRRCSTASASSPTSPSCRRCARPRSPTGSPGCTPPSATTPTCRSGSARSTSSSTAAP